MSSQHASGYMKKSRFDFVITFLGCVVVYALGIVTGYCAHDCKPARPAECKPCEPQKLEITLKVDGSIPVVGAIDVNGSVSGDAQIIVHHVGELCFPPEWPMNGFQVTPIEPAPKPKPAKLVPPKANQTSKVPVCR